MLDISRLFIILVFVHVNQKYSKCQFQLNIPNFGCIEKQMFCLSTKLANKLLYSSFISLYLNFIYYVDEF